MRRSNKDLSGWMRVGMKRTETLKREPGLANNHFHCSCLAVGFRGLFPQHLATMASKRGGKPQVQVFNGLQGLSDLWDADVKTRTRLREHQRLLLQQGPEGRDPGAIDGAVAKTVSNLRVNEAQVAPLLGKMVQHRNCIPCLETLESELELLHRANGLNPTSKTLSDEAWGLRYLFGTCKGLLYKTAPPRVP